MGINGTCFICHGHSSSKAIVSAVRAASEYVRKDINRLLIEVLRDSHDLKRLGSDSISRTWTQIREKVMH